MPARKLFVESSQAVRRSHLEELALGSIGTRHDADAAFLSPADAVRVPAAVG
jgi:hypothetical protein